MRFTNIPDGPPSKKSIYNQFPGLKVIFSGPSILKIIDDGVDLSRRAVVYHLQGLSFRELQYLEYMENAGIITCLYHAGSCYGKLSKAGKILFHHPNLAFALNSGEANSENFREPFFVNQVGLEHQEELPAKGDFLIDQKYHFEIGFLY